MGITDFYSTFKELAPNSFPVIEIKELCGLRVAVDISIFLYKFLKTNGDEWLSKFIAFVVCLKKHGLKPCFIFDGNKPPIEKQKVQQQRRADSQKIADKLELCSELYNQIAGYVLGTESVSDEIMSQLNILFPKQFFDKNSPETIISDLKITMQKLENQSSPITKQHISSAKRFIEAVGMKWIQASGEAEGLCAYLALRGDVDAVVSEDTDVLVYGTPILLSKFDAMGESFTLVELQRLLEESKLELGAFRDLCILLGCDYNSRIKGKPDCEECSRHLSHNKFKKFTSIGAKAAVCMIDVYHSIDEMEKYGVIEDVEPLNYKRCREIFSTPETISNAVIPYNLKIDELELLSFLKEHRLLKLERYILASYTPPEFVIEN